MKSHAPSAAQSGPLSKTAAPVAALSFDLDDTLWDFRKAVRCAELALYNWLLERAPGTVSVLVSPSDLQVYRQQAQQTHPELSSRLHVMRLESIRQVLRTAGENVSLAEEAYEVFYCARQQILPFDDVVPSLEWLSARFPLVAVTNGNSDLKASSLRTFFVDVLTAGGFGLAKPDQRIFHAAAEAARVPFTQLLHIGDDLHLDYIGARTAGLQAALLSRPGFHVQGVTTGCEWVVQDLHEICYVLAGAAGPGCLNAAVHPVA